MDPTTDANVAVLLARLDVKLDTIISATSDHELRLRKLESRRWPLPVASSVMALVALAFTIAPNVVIK